MVGNAIHSNSGDWCPNGYLMDTHVYWYPNTCHLLTFSTVSMSYSGSSSHVLTLIASLECLVEMKIECLVEMKIECLVVMNIECLVEMNIEWYSCLLISQNGPCVYRLPE
jgi:hypothetical protein